VRQVFRELKEDGDVLLRSRGIKIPDVDLGADMDYWPHYSTANAHGDFRRSADRGKTRAFKTVEDGIAGNIEYADAMTTASAYLRNVLEEVRLKDVEDSLAKRVGLTIDDALSGKEVGRIAKLRVKGWERAVDKLKNQVEQAELQNKLAKGQGQAELQRLRAEIKIAKRHDKALGRAIKMSVSVEHRAPRRPAKPERSAALAEGREAFSEVGEMGKLGLIEPEDLTAAANTYHKLVVAGRMDEATAAALMAKRTEYSEQLRRGVDDKDQLRGNLADLTTYRKALSVAFKDARVRGGNVPALEKKLSISREKLNVERKAWTALREKTWNTLPGTMFGRGQEEIPVALWNSKYYVPRDEDYARFAKQFDSLTGKEHTAPMMKALKAVEHAGNLARFLAATADFAGAFTQGLPLLMYNPTAWAKMTTSSFTAFFDPTVQGRYIQKNLDSMQSMLVEGRVPGAEIEMFKAIEKEGLARSLKGQAAPTDNIVVRGIARASNVGGTVSVASNITRFQRSYDSMLLITRHELWGALLPTWKGSKAELGDYIKKATGGLDPRSIGVGPNRQAVESLTFFAPRMLRSTLALAADAMKPWTEQGQMAAQTMMRLSAGMAGVMMLANVAYGGINGESEEEIEARISGALNPLDGRKFLSIPIGDHYYGVGGQVRGITQLLAKAVVDPKSMTKADAMDNPLIRFAQGRLSPAAGTGLGAAELLTDEEHNILPFNTIDSFPDLVEMSLTSALPFALQAAKEEGFDWSNPATYASPFVVAGPEVGGVRSSMFTPKDLLDKSAYARYGIAFNDLTDDEQAVVHEMNPDIKKVQDEMGDKNDKEYRKAKDKLDDTANGTLVILQEKLASTSADKITPRQYRMARAEALRDRRTALTQAQEDYGVEFGGGVDSDKRRLMNDFFDTYKQAELVTGMDWDLWEEKQAAFYEKVEGGAYGPAARAKQLLDERQGFDVEPDDWFEANADIIREADYWGKKDTAWPRIAEAVARVDPNIRSVQQLEDAILTSKDPNMGARLAALMSALEKLTTVERKKLRMANPALDRALLQNGYTTKVLTAEARGT